ncbi:MAG: cytochrome c3 family protein [Cognatishimia sp.]|uniref:cytochrome c3 family protein n=1 Tax=Cognatishimia sp. TaxID=2211648 RepID=UPI003B8BB14F
MLPGAQTIRKIALVFAIPVAVLGWAALTFPSQMTLVAHGPIQNGHTDLVCADCHIASPGTTRQQIQGKLHYGLGLREAYVDFGYAEITSKQCLACHERPNERHPIYRFNEPRFQDAAGIVDATSCLGCHSEHTGHRVFSKPQVCRACHGDLKLKADPLDVSHVDLIKQKNWDRCLGCHDFHGNHRHVVPDEVRNAIPEAEIRAYLRDGASPYGDDKFFEGERK